LNATALGVAYGIVVERDQPAVGDGDDVAGISAHSVDVGLLS
jgi:hypothetical protein